MMNKFLLPLCLILISSCAGHPDVRPGDGGDHRVVINTDDIEEGNRSAIRQADHYCDEFQKKAYFLSESKKYTGDMDEGTYNAGKRISKAAQVLGSGIFVSADSKKEQKTAKTVGLGGTAIDDAFGKGYTVEMKFRCR